MKQQVSRAWRLAFSGLFAITAVFGTACKAKEDLVTADPLNDPDRYSWQLFAEINRNAQGLDGSTVWETWATDSDLFDHPSTIPDWNRRSVGKLVLGPIVQHSIPAGTGLTSQTTCFPPNAKKEQEVRIDRDAFEYVVTNQLWYTEGLAQAFTNQLEFDFPEGAREVKSAWKVISPDQRSRYHWHVSGGKTYGLVALHVISKAVPRWTWATFEHVDNDGRCNGTARVDRFGYPPSSCSESKPSPALIELFKRAGLGPEWMNYRLDSSQIDYVDMAETPIRLGNSAIEKTASGESSCMTCHSQAAIDKNGNISIFRSIAGYPDPTWFFGSPPMEPLVLKNRPVDFVWSFKRALSKNDPPTECQKELLDETIKLPIE